MGGWWSPVGCLERVSGAPFLNVSHFEVVSEGFFYRFLSLVLHADLVQGSVIKYLKSGRQSTAMVRFFIPAQMSRASATASASPSIGAYLDSAACVDLGLSSSLVCGKKGRGWVGVRDRSEQCFWIASIGCQFLTIQWPGMWVWFCQRF